MRTSRRSMLLGLMGFAILAGLLVAYDASGLRQMIQPARVATVKISKVKEALLQEVRNNEQLKAMTQAVEAELRALEEKHNALKKQIQDLPEQSPERTQMLDELNYLSVSAEATLRFRQAELEKERAWRHQELLNSIFRAIDKLAAEEGYDIVIRDDSTDEPELRSDPQVPEAVQRARHLESRRVLYTAKTVDITEQLITRMNNAYKQVN